MKKISIGHIVILAFISRLLWLLVIDIAPVSDSAAYNAFATSIASGNGYAYNSGDLTAYWPVGTSAVYASIKLIFGDSLIFIGIFNLIIGVATVYLTWKTCAYYFNQTASLIAAMCMAVWPILIQFTTILASEIIFMFLVLASIWAWHQKTWNTVIRSLCFGALIALASYIRPTALPIIAILPVLAAFQEKNILENIKVFMISAITVAVITAPWSYRNTQVNNEFTYLSTNFGPNLWMGNNPDSSGAYMPLPKLPFESEKQRDSILKAKAVEFIKENPAQYLDLIVKRLNITFSRETIGVAWNRIGIAKVFGDNAIIYFKYLSTFFWLAILATGIIGALLKIWKDRWLSIFEHPLAIMCFFAVVPALTVGQDRYHMALIPFLAFYVGYISDYIYTLKTNRTQPNT